VVAVHALGKEGKGHAHLTLLNLTTPHAANAANSRQLGRTCEQVARSPQAEHKAVGPAQRPHDGLHAAARQHGTDLASRGAGADPHVADMARKGVGQRGTNLRALALRMFAVCRPGTGSRACPLFAVRRPGTGFCARLLFAGQLRSGAAQPSMGLRAAARWVAGAGWGVQHTVERCAHAPACCALPCTRTGRRWIHSRFARVA